MEKKQQAFGIVLLAAGSSARLGTPKQLLRYNGGSLLNNAIREAKGTEPNAMLVVLGAKAAMIREEIKDLGVDSMLNEHYQEGIASSIRCGLQGLLRKNSTLQCVMMMVCDQPHVNTAHLQALVHTYCTTEAKIVASDYAGRRGVPVLFNKSLFPELMLLKGDVGARLMMQRYQQETVGVPFPLGAVDVDTMEAYNALNEHLRDKKEHHD